MEVTVDVRLNGLEEKLESLGDKLAKKALRKALVQATKIWENEAKAKVPVDTGALRESIKTKVVMSAKQDRGTASVSPMYDPSLGKAGKDTSQDPGVYGMFVEFGLKNRQMPAQPWLRPAFDSKAEAVLSKFVEVLAEGLSEVAK